MSTWYIVDCPKNRELFPELVGMITQIPPTDAVVELVGNGKGDENESQNPD